MTKFFLQHKLLTLFLLLSFASIICSLCCGVENNPIAILLVQIAVGYIINVIFYFTLSFLPEKKKMEAATKIIAKRISQIITDMRAFPDAMVKQFPSNYPSRAEQIRYATTMFYSDMILEYAGIWLHDTGEETSWTAGAFLYTKLNDVEQNIFFVLKYYSYNIKPELDEVFDKILHSRVHTVFKRLFSGNKKITYNSDWIEDYDSLANELEKIQRLYE